MCRPAHAFNAAAGAIIIVRNECLARRVCEARALALRLGASYEFKRLVKAAGGAAWGRVSDLRCGIRGSLGV